MKTTNECAVCCAHGLSEEDQGDGLIEVERDDVRDGLGYGSVYLCIDCWHADADMPRLGAAIAEEARSRGVTLKYIDHDGDGDARVTLWEVGAGDEAIDTNGGPVWEGEEGFEELRARIMG